MSPPPPPTTSTTPFCCITNTQRAQWQTTSIETWPLRPLTPLRTISPAIAALRTDPHIAQDSSTDDDEDAADEDDVDEEDVDDADEEDDEDTQTVDSADDSHGAEAPLTSPSSAHPSVEAANHHAISAQYSLTAWPNAFDHLQQQTLQPIAYTVYAPSFGALQLPPIGGQLSYAATVAQPQTNSPYASGATVAAPEEQPLPSQQRVRAMQQRARAETTTRRPARGPNAEQRKPQEGQQERLKLAQVASEAKLQPTMGQSGDFRSDARLLSAVRQINEDFVIEEIVRIPGKHVLSTIQARRASQQRLPQRYAHQQQLVQPQRQQQRRDQMILRQLQQQRQQQASLQQQRLRAIQSQQRPRVYQQPQRQQQQQPKPQPQKFKQQLPYQQQYDQEQLQDQQPLQQENLQPQTQLEFQQLQQQYLQPQQFEQQQLQTQQLQQQYLQQQHLQEQQQQHLQQQHLQEQQEQHLQQQQQPSSQDPQSLRLRRPSTGSPSANRPKSSNLQSNPSSNGVEVESTGRTATSGTIPTIPFGSYFLPYLSNGGQEGSEGKRTAALILEPHSRAVVGNGGTAISTPISKAYLKRGVPTNVYFNPESVAIAGVGGKAHAQADLELELITRRR